LKNLLAHVAAVRHEFGKRLFLDFFALILFHKNKSFPRGLVPRNELRFKSAAWWPRDAVTRERLPRNSIDFEQDVRRLDDGDPGFERAFAFAHSRFQRFLGEGFWGKTRIHILPWRFMLRATATRAASICLVSSQQRSRAIKTVLAKSNRLAARGKAGAATAVHFAVLNSFGH